MDSYDILVIVLSVLLGLFLLLGILVLVKIRSLLAKLDKISDSAQHAAANFDDITSKLSSAASFSAVGSVATSLIKYFKKKGK